MSTDPIIAAVPALPDFAKRAINLADRRAGAATVACTDDFFGPSERMLDPAPAAFYPDRYDDHGKWMDGWETRRRRDSGHDWCIVRLAMPGRIHGVEFDTSFFTGNFAPAASMEACYSPDHAPGEGADWTELVPAMSLAGNDHRFATVEDHRPWTHVRVHLYPDGGLARLRIYGEAWCDWARRDPEAEYDLLAEENGGRMIACNDAHFGSPANLLRPGRGVNMGDGWETRRRREPGSDWCILQLGHPGLIERVDLDTAHFKGNFPDRCSIQAAAVSWGTSESIITQSMFWDTLLTEQKLTADAIHSFTNLPREFGPVTHIRLNLIPDGGLSRIRLWGRLWREQE